MSSHARTRILFSAAMWCACAVCGICRSVSGDDGADRLITFTEAAVSDVNTIYIPFTLIGQLIVVQARIDTLEGNFIVDTGAERLLLNDQYFRSRRPTGSVAAVGNTGKVSEVSWYSVDSLSLAQLKIPDLQAHLTDLQHIELKKNTRFIGIIGYNVFRDFAVLIDFPEQLIMLSRLDRNGVRIDASAFKEVPEDSLSFILKKHLILLQAKVNSTGVTMILDSGAELNLLDRRVKRKALDNFTILKRVNLVGAGRKEVEVIAGTLKGVQCGHIICNEMNTLLTSLDAINEGFGTAADGVLGYEFIKNRRIMINYKTQKLYFFAALRP